MKNPTNWKNIPTSEMLCHMFYMVSATLGNNMNYYVLLCNIM